MPSPETTQEPRGPVVVVTGPTAAGKSSVALALAERFGGEIVNCDSQQVYRCMDIGTAKASPADRARVPHHLLDVVDPDVQYHAARYAAEASQACEAIHARGHAVFLCGGTGLYIRALLEGLSAQAGGSPALRADLETEHEEAVRGGDPGRLHRRLAKVDPERAAELHPNDVRRVIRALEIFASTGKPASAQQREVPAAWRYPTLHLALDPGKRLRERIDARCEAMLEGGLLWEVRGLRERGFGPELRSMQAIGYRHMQPVIEGRSTLAAVLPELKSDTWQLARRQRTWIRAIEQASWLDPDDSRSIEARVDAFLAPAWQRGEQTEGGAAREAPEGASLQGAASTRRPCS